MFNLPYAVNNLSVKDVARLYNLNFRNTIKPTEPNCTTGAKKPWPKSLPNKLVQKLVFISVYMALINILTRKKAGTNI